MKKLSPKSVSAIAALAVTVLSQMAYARPAILDSYLSVLLSNPTVTSIYQDSEDLVWIGTQEGLYRFDGQSTTSYSTSPSADSLLPSDDIRAIFESANGSIFIWTYQGKTYRLDKSENIFREIFFGGSSTVDRPERIFQLDKDLVLIENYQSTTILHLGRQSALPLGEIRAKSKDHSAVVGAEKLTDDKYAVGTEDGVFLFDSDLNIIKSIYLPTNGSRITALTSDQRGKVFLTTSDNRLLAISSEHEVDVNFIKLPGTEQKHVTDIAHFGKHIWVGTDAGLLVFDENFTSFSDFSRSNSRLKNNHVLVLHGSANYLWVGTYQGLNQVSFSPFHTFTREHGGEIGDTHAFAETAENQMLIGTYEGLFRKDEGSNSHVRVIEGSSSTLLLRQPIISIAQIKDIALIGTWRSGVLSVKTRDWTTERISVGLDLDLAITKILRGMSNETWIASYNGGLYKIDKNGKVSDHFLANSSITAIYESRNGRLIATDGEELFLYDDKGNTFLKLNVLWPVAQANHLILSLAETSDGNLLIGTKGAGIYYWDQDIQSVNQVVLNKFSHDRTIDHISFNAMEVDINGLIWSATNSGIVQLKENGELIGHYGRSYDIQGDDFNVGASFKDSSENIYFGGPNGYTMFDPSDVKPRNDESPLFLTKIVYLDSSMVTLHDVSKIEHVQVRHSTHSIEFHFSLRDFVDPKAHNYRYQLTGFDVDWIDNGNRNTARYTNLPAGSYAFQVQGANSAGIWNEDGIDIQVIVLPHPARTWWAFCLYVLTACLFVWVVKRYYDNYTRKEQATKMADEMVATAHQMEDELQGQQELQDEIVSELHHHNRENLALIREVSLEGVDTEQIELLQLLERLYQHGPSGLTVDFRALTDAVINKLLPVSSVPLETLVTINTVPERHVPAEEAAPLAIALGELLRNALTHAFHLDSPSNFIQVDLHRRGESGQNCYELVVSDDGIGLPDGICSRSGTQGFAILKRLAARYGGSFSLNTESGTVAAFTLPARDR